MGKNIRLAWSTSFQEIAWGYYGVENKNKQESKGERKIRHVNIITRTDVRTKCSF